ncbi:hypothetical protein WN55_07167 [Dufourea novaeangliae]|uniref:Uncharacterized protein n=1 Tax=Dufourea novaeangliae TaxID=178035 RepID=A0A154P2H9_DUFNO|nr:hypothetical protein WN55_07167 [Dufourea novaeangliae]
MDLGARTYSSTQPDAARTRATCRECVSVSLHDTIVSRATTRPYTGIRVHVDGTRANTHGSQREATPYSVLESGTAAFLPQALRDEETRKNSHVYHRAPRTHPDEPTQRYKRKKTGSA